jgi:broad specificity phosphatase PhoE
MKVFIRCVYFSGAYCMISSLWLFSTSIRSCQAVSSRSLSVAAAAAAAMTHTAAAAAIADHKELIIVRHGQAQHNPRAEVAKAGGCSHDEFIALMREDDALDAALTEEGRHQAQAARLSSELATPIRLVVSSSLSRALETADHVHPPTSQIASQNNHIRVCYEHFREVNGDMLNAKRRPKSELAQSFPHWDFDELSHEEDSLWTPVMEDLGKAAERGYLGFQWLMDRPERHILLVSHGGILRYTMNDHPLVVLRDERSQPLSGKPVEARFDNCEMRRYRLSWEEDERGEGERRTIVLTQIDDTVEPKEL